jgi:septal ring factor EnvC (AmiA/AmiB activator)
MFCLLIVTLPLAAQQSDTAKARKELAGVREEIAQSEEQRKAHLQKLAEAEEQLKASDEKLADASRAVNEQQKALSRLAEQLTGIDQQKQKLEVQRQAQQVLLAEQVKAAYQVGGHDYTQMLLNQQNALQLERLLTYYQYFNNARMKQLTELKRTVSELENIAATHQSAVAEQQQRVDQLQQQKNDLANARTEQKVAVKTLQDLLAEQKQQLAYLKSNEKSLQATIDKLKEKAALRRQEYKGKKQGQLPWPVKGQIVQKFGASHGGETSASGIIIQAQAGQFVKAVNAGQVIYADWLKGYGWVIVIDHGNGLMSLYGHNQSLLKAPGDEVKAGDSVALVGQSGGLGRPGLYFEIRQKGSAVDPMAWLRSP